MAGVGGSLGRISRYDLEHTTYFGLLCNIWMNTSDVYIEMIRFLEDRA